MDKKVLLIINPKAGMQLVTEKISHILDFYIKNGFMPTIYFTQKKDDVKTCILFIKNKHEDFDLIVCFGGDGSLSETISTCIDYKINKKIAYIPCGSTNDTSYTLNIPNDLNKALKISISKKSKEIDILKFNNKKFLYVAAFGMFTNLSYEVSQDAKNILGYFAYILQGITLLSDIKTFKVSIEYEDKRINDDFLAGLVLNTTHVAGLKNPLNKHTKINDGKFEVLLIKKPNTIIEFNDLIAYLTGVTKKCNLITFFQTNKLKVKSKELKWTLDGENGGKINTALINIMKKAVKISSK